MTLLAWVLGGGRLSWGATPTKEDKGRSSDGVFGGSHHKAFSNDSDLVQHIRQTYFIAYPPTFYKEVIYELANVFREMAEMASLLGTKVHPVQDQWRGRKELCCANYVVRWSTRDLQYFRVVAPIESPKIMGLWGIHSPKVLKHLAGLSFWLWCRKEGKNKGTIINLLHTCHYCLGLVCERCLSYFMTMLDQMQHHSQGCEFTCSNKTTQIEKWRSLCDTH